MNQWRRGDISSYIMGIEGQFHPDPFLIKIFDDFVKITASNSVKLSPKFPTARSISNVLDILCEIFNHKESPALRATGV